MVEHTHLNYLEYSGSGPTWNVTIHPYKRKEKILSFYEESVISAEHIWNNKTGKLHVLLSGGMDSEFVCQIFLSLGMNVTPVILRTQYNHHDTAYAFKFCKNSNIDPLVIDLDYDKFIDTTLMDIALATNCSAYQVVNTMWLAKQIDGTVITGDLDPHLTKCTETNKWFLDEIEPLYRQSKWWIDEGIVGTPFFLSYTVDMLIAFLEDPTIKKLTNNEIRGKLGTYSSKVHVFNNQTKFKIEARQKMHGGEFLETQPIFLHENFKIFEEMKKKCWGVSYHEYSSILSSLSNNLKSEGSQWKKIT